MPLVDLTKDYTLYLTEETDPIFTAHPAHDITSVDIDDWNEAASWGDHSLAGYLTSYTETDPVWNAEKSSYYTKVNLQTSGQSSVHWGNLTNVPAYALDADVVHKAGGETITGTKTFQGGVLMQSTTSATAFLQVINNTGGLANFGSVNSDAFVQSLAGIRFSGLGGSVKAYLNTATGNLIVGNGTTDAGYRLDVNGTLRTGDIFTGNTSLLSRRFAGRTSLTSPSTPNEVINLDGGWYSVHLKYRCTDSSGDTYAGTLTATRDSTTVSHLLSGTTDTGGSYAPVFSTVIASGNISILCGLEGDTGEIVWSAEALKA